MEVLDFVETQAQRSAAFSIAGLEAMRARAHTVLSLLLAGAGASGTYAMGQIGKPGGIWILAGLGAASAWWFILAGRLAVGALRTVQVSGPASRGADLQAQAKRYDTYVKEVEAEGGPPEHTIDLLRAMEVRISQQCAESHSAASTAAANALDRCYLHAAFTPLFVAAGLGIAGFFI